jgi:hypothetical protein
LVKTVEKLFIVKYEGLSSSASRFWPFDEEQHPGILSAK